jgi:hypothetical protein
MYRNLTTTLAQTLISSHFLGHTHTSFSCLSRNLGLVLLLVDASLNLVDYRVECSECEALRLPDTRLPSIRDPFFDKDGLDVLDTSSEYGEEPWSAVITTKSRALYLDCHDKTHLELPTSLWFRLRENAGFVARASTRLLAEYSEMSLAVRSLLPSLSFPEADARRSLMKGPWGFAWDETIPVSSPERPKICKYLVF